MPETPKENKSALAVFFRIPEYGRVKKRLASQIGDDMALMAYQAMLYETLRNVQKLKGTDIYGFYEGSLESARDFPKAVCYIPQKGKNLGHRMSNAVNYLLEARYKRIVMIGSDSPDLPLDFIQKAFDMLNLFELVIGPAKDGGYYLIGMSKPINQIFKGITWGRNDVLKKTLSKANQYGIYYYLLPEWYDIDDLANLTIWLKNQRGKINDFAK